MKRKLPTPRRAAPCRTAPHRVGSAANLETSLNARNCILLRPTTLSGIHVALRGTSTREQLRENLRQVTTTNASISRQRFPELRYNFTQVRLTVLLKCEWQHAKLSPARPPPLPPAVFCWKILVTWRTRGWNRIAPPPWTECSYGDITIAGSHLNANKYSLTILYSIPKISYFVKSNQFEICFVNFGIIFV